MALRFLDRENESARLRRAFRSREGTLCCLYGRRRCGKSRLLQETLPAGRSVYYAADQREAPLQRRGLAAAVAELVPGFGGVEYPDWEALLVRWRRDAPAGAVLAIDEFPWLVQSAPELPSLLQKAIDDRRGPSLRLAICGSAQRMMQGLVLDATAPLYGRAREILRIGPLEAGWTAEALRLRTAREAVEAWSVWGGVPRYWEAASEHRSLWPAVRELVLDPLGVFHREPERLLLDDLRDTVQAASILSLVGRGCHRLSEIAGRVGKPAPALVRPIDRLLELGLLRRDTPLGAPERGGRKSLYRIDDPFLAFWFRFVEPARSRLAAGQADAVLREIRGEWSDHVGRSWEILARRSAARLVVHGARWKPAQAWWGAGTDAAPLELDIVAESLDGKDLLVGEARFRLRPGEASRALAALSKKAGLLPIASRYRRVHVALFIVEPSIGDTRDAVVSAERVLRVLR